MRLAWLLIVAVAGVGRADVVSAVPTVEHPAGWRGDGTGRYGSATPPIVWERRMRTPLAQLRSTVEPVEDGKPSGELLKRTKGTFQPTRWLVLAPLPAGEREDDALKNSSVGDEAALAPKPGDSAAGSAWRAVGLTRGIDFFQLLGMQDGNRLGYLFCNVFAAHECEFGLRCEGNRGNYRIWLNGKPQDAWDQARHTFRAGWNRLLIKVILRGRTTDSNVEPQIYPFPGPELSYTTRNIAWTRPMPGPSFAMPLMVGDRLFVTSEPNDLICIDKNTGKPLWMASDTLWHALIGGAEHRQELEALRPMTDKLDQANRQFLETWDPKLGDDRRKLAQDLTDQTRKIDRAYGVSLGWGGGNSTPTPCSDGQHVYVWRGETGVFSCYDPDGTVKWRRFQHTGTDAEHGFNSSPILAGDVIGVIGGSRVFGFDRRDGRTLWIQKYAHVCYASMAAARIDGQDVFVTPVGMILRASDGKILQKAFGQFDGECASPVIDNDRFYLVARAGFCTAQLPRKIDGETTILNRLTPEALQDAETYPVGSPACDGGLVFFTHSGWTGHQWPMLFAIDPAGPRVLFNQRLDFTPEIHYAPDGAGVAASICIAGGYGFVTANRGETIVFKPGRTYQQLAKNTVESISPQGRQEITEGEDKGSFLPCLDPRILAAQSGRARRPSRA